MLDSVHIENSRSCKHTTIAGLGPITALVGRNAVGKTNVLRAIEWAARMATSIGSVEQPDRWDYGQPTRVILEFHADATTYRYGLEVSPGFLISRAAASNSIPRGLLKESVSERTPTGDWVPLLERDGESIVLLNRVPVQTGPTTPALVAIQSLLPQEELTRRIQPAASILRRIRYYPLDEPSSPITPPDAASVVPESVYLEWLTHHKDSVDTTGSLVMRLIQLSQERPQELDELRDLVGPDGLGVLDHIAVQVLDPHGAVPRNMPAETETSRPNRFYIVSFEPSRSSAEAHPLPYASLSLGTRRILRILVALLFDRSSVLLLEQPEDAIHPGLLHKLIPLIRSYLDPAQCILTSHSFYVFNRLEPDELRLVTAPDGATQVNQLTATQVAAARDYISDEGSLAEFLEALPES